MPGVSSSPVGLDREQRPSNLSVNARAGAFYGSDHRVHGFENSVD
ncbi:MAG: hypothetical protein ACREEI_01490 [Stellaceae bacterium]